MRYIDQITIKNVIDDSNILITSIEDLRVTNIKHDMVVFSHEGGDLVFDIPEEWDQVGKYLMVRNRKAGLKPFQVAYPFKVIEKMGGKIKVKQRLDDIYYLRRTK